MAELPGIGNGFGGDWVSSKVAYFTELDKEWIQLIVEAKNLGLEISTIKNFLKGHVAIEVLFEK
jgi:hypothetical protein